jgi:hypothetical protein
MDHKEVGLEGVDWICVDQDWGHGLAAVKMEMNLYVSESASILG